MKNLRLSRKLFTSLLITFIISLSLLCLYYASSFTPSLRNESKISKTDSFSISDDQNSILASTHFPKSFPICDMKYSELIPCLDRNLLYQLKLKLNLALMEHYERHCPSPNRRFNCVIPPPVGYKVPIKWPKSRDEVWKVNIPHTHLADEKSDQRWMVVNGDKINFPGGGTHFHYGADKYIVSLAQWNRSLLQAMGVRVTLYSSRALTENHMLNFPNDKLNNDGNIRSVLDVGCGVASFGAYLLPLDILAMSLAPNDVHENQIQFALERGIPATLGVLGTRRLPYPSRSFEMAHCSRCRIDWLQRDGLLLMELDRVLRPGGYFVYSSPEAYAHDPENRRIWTAMSDLVHRMCWRIASKKNQTVIWSKPLSNGCYKRRDPGTLPPMCGPNDDPDAVWNVPMKACITPYTKKVNRAKGSELAPWPKRLTAPPPRLEELGISSEKYQEDTEVWHWRVKQYWNQMKSKVAKNTFRNVMDMKANLGGFAASLADKDVWVMNVVPVNESNKLKIVYDRGLLGSVHDWCESFSTYPRTYDLLHAWLLFSDIQKQGCSLVDLLIEMDRILRPHGFAIIRDKLAIINYVKRYLSALKWDVWSSEVEPTVDALSSKDEERVLIVQKRLWNEAPQIMQTA